MFAFLLSDKLDPFYQNISSFPTAIFTFLLVIVVLFWAIAILGLVDLDFLDIDLPETEGSLNVDSNGGAAETGAIGGLLLKFGLAGVPITVIVSLIALFGWFISYYSVYFLSGLITTSSLLKFLLGIPILLASLYISILITAQLIKPLRPLFQKMQQNTIAHIIGQTAVVRTSKVNHSFGEATLEDGGAGLILKVRSREEEFSRNDRVVLLEYDKETNSYWVISEAEFNS